MKKITYVVAAIAMIGLSFTACSTTETKSTTTTTRTRHSDTLGGSPGSGDVSTMNARGPM